MTIGDRIRRSRIAANLTQADVAKHIKTTPQAIFKYENGIVTNIPLDKLEAIAKLFNVTPAYLMGWDSSIFSPNSLTSLEKKVIIAYRNNPDMRGAVNRLLGVDSSDQKTEPTVRIYRAARSTDDAPATIEERPLSDIERLRKAKKVTSDEDL